MQSKWLPDWRPTISQFGWLVLLFFGFSPLACLSWLVKPVSSHLLANQPTLHLELLLVQGLLVQGLMPSVGPGADAVSCPVLLLNFAQSSHSLLHIEFLVVLGTCRHAWANHIWILRRKSQKEIWEVPGAFRMCTSQLCPKLTQSWHRHFFYSHVLGLGLGLGHVLGKVHLLHLGSKSKNTWWTIRETGVVHNPHVGIRGKQQHRVWHTTWQIKIMAMLGVCDWHAV